MREVEAHLLSMFSSMQESSEVATTDRKAWILGQCCAAKGKRESVDVAVLYLCCITRTAPGISVIKYNFGHLSMGILSYTRGKTSMCYVAIQIHRVHGKITDPLQSFMQEVVV